MNCPITGKPCLKHKGYTVTEKKDGEGKTHSVCEDCLHLNRDVWVSDEFGACPSCGTTLESIVKNSRIGCAGCYSHFETPLPFIIASVQAGAESHKGKPPQSHKKLVSESTRAVAFATEILVKIKSSSRDEKYEEAARLNSILLKVKELISRSDEKGELLPADREELSKIIMDYRWPEST